jgi:hypothetical protein
MAKLWRLIVGAMLVIHLTVGCCAHHGHASEATSPCASDCGDDASHRDCTDGVGSQADHGHHAPHDCQGGKCFLVPPNPLAKTWFGQPFQVSFIGLLDGSSSLSGFSSEQRLLPRGRFSLPVRLHLANQVLLI